MWKRVSGYEDLYLINEYGVIMSQKNSRIIKPYVRGNGYACVHLSKNGEFNTVNVHRLVARHFVPNPHSFEVVNHVDGVKTNNHYKNLEWCTHSNNIRHAWKNDLIKITEKSRKASSQNMINYIESGGRNKAVICKETGITYKSLSEASRQENIQESSINKALRGVYRTAGGYHWEYANEVSA